MSYGCTWFKATMHALKVRICIINSIELCCRKLSRQEFSVQDFGPESHYWILGDSNLFEKEGISHNFELKLIFFESLGRGKIENAFSKASGHSLKNAIFQKK